MNSIGWGVALLFVSMHSAWAHQSSVVYLDLRVSGREALVTVRMSAADLVEVVHDPHPTEDLLRRSASSLYDHVGRTIRLSHRADPCPSEARDLSISHAPAGLTVDLSLRYVCPHYIEQLTVDYDLFFDLDPRHQGFAKAELQDGASRQFLFRTDERRWEVGRPVSTWSHAWRYFKLGLEHIFTGYDHILFLCGLLLVAGVSGSRARGLREGLVYTLKITTAFTVAHSLTLAASALGWAQLPVRLTESGIALSIAYIGAENLLAADPKYRWLLTFGFGLVHGFGFASVLREIGLPRQGLLTCLASFNVGVEAGQLCIVAALFPLLHAFAIRSPNRYRHFLLRPGSVIVLVLGLIWFFQRLFF